MTLKDYLNDGDRFAANNGAKLVEIKDGYAKAEMTVTAGHLNAGGVCQGGAVFTLADLVFAALVNQRENLTFAINSTIYYHVSAKEDDVLTAIGHFISDHHKIPAVEVEVRKQDGVRVATFTGQAYTGRTPHMFDSLE
ncbi:MAG: hotdog fold thioesterase [Bacteroidales bacterium]|nr:hotdog fold thioesterase [Bacteroidales bacterium]